MFVKFFFLALLLSPLACFAADIAAMKADGTAALGDQRFEEAAAIYRSVLKADPGDAEANYRLGSALLALNRDAGAIGAFQAALDGGFQPAGARLRLAQLHARNERPDEAVSQLRAAAEAGFGGIGLVDGIAEFEPLRESEDFQAAFAAVRANRYPCEADPNAHAFDFWIGEWDVYVAGQLVGTNSIKPILNHCALSEEWASATGGFGRSYNYYDTGTRTWNQLWISDSGSFVEFEGAARDGGIFYTAKTINPADGSETLHKFYFTVFDNGDVRQVWELSGDGGKSWNTTWDSRYVRKAAASEPPD